MKYNSFHISKGGTVKKFFLVMVVFIVALFLWKSKTHKNSAIIMLPEKTVFFIDDGLSNIFKKDLIRVIDLLYSDLKNPEAVIKETNNQFAEIASMTVQICQSDKICFYLDAAPAVFLLNDNLVVCENGATVAKNHFKSEILQTLIPVVSQHCINIPLMIQFIKKLPNLFKAEFCIFYEDVNNVLLISKNDKSFALQLTLDEQVTEKDLVDCQAIGLQLPKKMKAKKKQVVYDLRFKNQIIVR